MRNQTRDFGPALRRAGVVETARGPKVSDDIQQVYVMDDLSKMLPSLVRPQFMFAEVSPTNALRRGRIEISPPPDSAIVIPWFRNDDGANQITWSSPAATLITNDLAAFAPDLEMGAETRALLQEGTGGIAGTLVLAAGEDLPANFPPLVIYPGRLLSFVSNIVNVACQLSLAWFEVPLQADTV
jgi:hypothetical protein